MLDKFKILLGIEAEDVDRDELFVQLLDTAKARLKILLGGIAPPAEMEHIVIEVAIIRFNRIGSEGLASHTVEGESLSFTDSDFAGFSDEIQAFLDTRKETSRGKVRFV